MRKIIFICFLLVAILTISSPLFAVHPLAISLLSQCAFDSDFGNPVDTYEDVKPITNIGPTETNLGPTIKHSTLNQFVNKVVSDDVGQALLNKINSTSGRVLYDPGFLHFMKKFMYIQGGGYDEYGVWHYGAKLQGFPVEYDPGNDPHVASYYLCLNSSPPPWYFIPPVTLAPNAKSCHHDDDLCDYPPCVKAVKEDNDGNGNDDDNGNGIPGEVITPAQHNQPTNNVYVNLGNYLYNQKTPGFSVDKNQSAIKFEMKFKDRTPPVIDGCVAGEFPEIGAPPADPATTGDWYKVDGLKITDNKTDFVGTCLCLGKIDGYPDSSSWIDDQDWVPQLPFQKIPSDSTTQNVILPNVCHGIMEYTIFAWDEIDEDTFGERNGFGGEIVAVLNEPLQEDVEYLINIWMDDNVKWATKSPTGAILSDIHPIPTGIDDGEIKIEIRNQVPAFSFSRPIDRNKAVSEEIKVVFREPTIDSLGGPPTSGANFAYFQNGNFPFIEVWVKDYSGLQRKIKLFLKISNENPDIRIIESEHGKSG
jgi:hypothetical protein